MGTTEPSGSVVLVGAAVRLTVCWPKATAAANGRMQTTRSAAFKIAFILFVRIVIPRRQLDSSITNSRESTSIIISIPPGKILLVVISRSLCECHINAQPRSLAGLACVLEGSKVVQPALVVVSQAGAVARRLASGPR